MRNKHNEGYTLPLVMVVLLVLAIVAVTIMTTSLKNMQRQQSFIETMKAQYAAQGEIEKIVAQLENGQEVEIQFKTSEGYAMSYTETTLSGIIVESCGNVVIECGIKLTAKAVSVTEGTKTRCIIDTIESIEYTSYEIIKGGAAQ